MNINKLREGQRLALNILQDRIADKQPTTSIVLPTRYGKSDVMRLAAYICKAAKVAGSSLVLSPSEFLRNQIVSPEKIISMVQRYQLPFDMAGTTKVRAMTDAFEWKPFSNGEYLLSATIQLASRQIDRMKQLAEHCAHEMGGPLIVHIDECQETSEQKKRGLLVTKLTEAGALVVLYTATAVRADGEIIPGFSVEVLSEEESIRYECRETENPDTIRIDKYSGIKRMVRLKADHETTFRQAWNEKPSPVCNLSREVVDVQILDKNNDLVLLSECSKSKASELLGQAVRHPEVIRKGVKMLLAELSTRKRVNPSCAAMIFTCNDDGDIANAHAKEVLKEIKDQQVLSDAPLEGVIVTMKSEEGDEKSTKAIERFVSGQGDILIVKQMGGSGLDSGRLKVLLDLSSQRTVASVIQRLMRVATPWEGIRTGTVITLADATMEAIWNRYVVSEGGEEEPTGSVFEDELVDSYEKQKTEIEKGSDKVTGAQFMQFDDNNGEIADAAMLSGVERILSDFPWLTQHMTKAEIANTPSVAVIAGKTISQDKEDITPLGSQISKLRESINSRKDELIKSQMRGMSYSQDEWAKRASAIMTEAYIAVGVPKGTQLKQIKNIETLNLILARLTPCQAN